MKHTFKIIILVCLLVITNGCVTVFSDFQSARTLGEGNKEVTGNISGVSYSEDGESGYYQTNIGAQFGYGINEKVDLRLRVENMNLDGASENFKYYAIGFGPKFSLIENKMALYVPLGFAFGEDLNTDETFEVHPTLLYSFPVSDDFEINTSGKYIFAFEDGRDNSVALNLGLGIFSSQFTFRPELGIMIYPSSDGILFHFGTGVSYNF